MSSDSYQLRQNLLQDHISHIRDLGKDKMALTVRLEMAETEIGTLQRKVQLLERKLSELETRQPFNTCNMMVN